MREIKFRAWDTVRNEIFRCGEIYIEIKGEVFLDLLTYKARDRFILMQFTGLLDKNGKEIYEGDLLKEWKGRIRKVQWETNSISDGWYAPFIKEDWVYGFSNIHCAQLVDRKDAPEIIGNIYENPELVKP